jgi:hypothetical protein
MESGDYKNGIFETPSLYGYPCRFSKVRKTSFSDFSNITTAARRQTKITNNTLLTMSKTPPDAKHNRAQPFSFKKKDWPDEGNKLKVKLEGKQGGATFDEYVRVLDGSEHPELFLLWIQEYDRRIRYNDRLKPPQRLEVLIRMVKGKTLSKGDKVISECRDESVPGKKIFRHKPTVRRYAAMTREERDAFCATDEFHMDVIEECLYALKLEVFGNDIIGRKSYTGLRRHMRAFKVDLNHGIRKWATRMDDLQSYLPHLLWEAGESRGETLDPFGEHEMREILDAAIHKQQQEKLLNIDWDILEHSYQESIAKLDSIERSVVRETQTLQRLSQLEKLTGSPSKAGAKSGGGRKSKSNNNNKGKTTGKREACKYCGKFHKGECWLKNGGGPKNKKPRLDKESLNMIAEHFGDHFGLTRKPDEEGTWKEGLPEAEKLFVMGAASQDQDYSGSDISIDSDSLKTYRSNYKRVCKKKRSRRK